MKRIAVIPTCADLERFRLVPQRSSNELVIGCVGTVLSGWFLVDWLRSFIYSLFRAEPAARFVLTTKDSAEEVLKVIRPEATWGNRLSIGSGQPEDMPKIQMAQDASVMFFSPGISKIGSCPTRMAEALGCGKPIITNAGVGDMDSVVRKHQVGVIAAGASSEDMDKCIDELMTLLRDPTLAGRCRKTAEEEFSLEFGVNSYRSLYREILS